MRKADKMAMRLDLSLNLLQLRSKSEVLSQAFPPSGGVPEILGAVAWVILATTDAVVLAAFSKVDRNDTGTEISQCPELVVEIFSLNLEVFQMFFHVASFI
jgi:hypothetical protein